MDKKNQAEPQQHSQYLKNSVPSQRKRGKKKKENDYALFLCLARKPCLLDARRVHIHGKNSHILNCLVIKLHMFLPLLKSCLNFFLEE